MVWRFLYIVFLSISIVSPLLSQEFAYSHYTIKDGLVQSQVTALIQDSKGYLWIGTKSGISRFNGHNFKNYTINDGLPNKNINYLTEDESGKIWFIAGEYLGFLHNDKIITYTVNELKSLKAVVAFYSTNADCVNIAIHSSDNQLVIYNFCNGKLKNEIALFEKTTDEWPEEPFFDGYFDHSTQIIWISADPYGLFKISNGKAERINFKHTQLQGVMPDGKGSVYAMAKDTVFHLDNGNWEVTHPYSPWPRSRTFRIKAYNSEGYFSMMDFDQKLSFFYSDKVYKDKFVFPSISLMYYDKEDNLWIGTEAGLFKLLSHAFVNYIPGKCDIYELIWSITEDRHGRIWFGSYAKGLQYLEGNNFKSDKSYKRFGEFPDILIYPGSTKLKNGDNIFNMTHIGALRYDGRKFSKLFKGNLEFTSLFCFEDTNSKTLYLGTYGLVAISQNKEMQYYGIHPGNGKGKYIVSIIKDKLGRIWLGGFNGISLLQGDKITHLPSNDIPFEKGGNAMLSDSLLNLWIGNANGLFFYDYDSIKKLKHPAIESMITSLAQVGDSLLLIGTIKNFLVMDLYAWYNQKIILIDEITAEEGFCASETGQNLIFKDSQGSYWIGSSDRVVRFYPEMYKKNRHSPKVYISSLSCLSPEMEWIKENLAPADGIVYSLGRNQRNVKLDFEGVSTSASELIKYSYTLSGYDLGWSEPATDHYAVYTNLPPGNYQFKVRAFNSDMISSEYIAVLNFEIRPAYFQTWLFWLLLVVISALALLWAGYGISKKKEKRIKQELMLDQKMSQLKLLALRNQMEPHFTFNTLNSIGSVLMKDDNKAAYRLLVKLSKLLRSYIESGDNLTTTLQSELETVNGFLEIVKFRFSDKFDYSIQVDQDATSSQLIPKMAIQIFVENAVKHGIMPKDGKGQLTITVKNHLNFLIFEIIDDGVGRKNSANTSRHSTGKGLMIIAGYFDYFNRINQNKLSYEIIDLFDNAGVCMGTKVVVRIPLNINV